MPNTTLMGPELVIRMYPSFAKLLLLAVYSLVLDLLIYFPSIKYIPQHVAFVLACLPTVIILGRWIIRRPALSLDSQGITLCNFSFRKQRFLWEDIIGIRRVVGNSSRGLDPVYLKIITRNNAKTIWNGWSGGTLIAELLLPMPVTAVMLRIAKSFQASARQQILLFTPPVAVLEIREATYHHPWTWSVDAVLWGLRIGSPLGLILGPLLAIDFRFFPQYGDPVPIASIVAGGIGIFIALVWPIFIGYWLTRKARGNKVPAIVASESVLLIIYFCLIKFGGKAEIPFTGICIVLMPIVAVLMWLAASDIWTRPFGWDS